MAEEARGQFVREIGAEETVASAVVDAVSEYTGREARSSEEADGLVPLHDSIDPDALEALLRSSNVRTTVTFGWEGCEITIDGGTHVIVSSAE